MHRGVEQGGVQPEPPCFGGGFLREAHFGEDVVAAPPDALQTLEGGPVTVVGGLEPGVEVVHGYVYGVMGRPLGERGPVGCCRLAGGEQSTGVAGPGLVAFLAVRAGVHVQRAVPGVVGCPDRHLDGSAALFGKDERRFEVELDEMAAADLVAGVDRQFHECGAGQQGRAQDGVVGQPGMGPRRQPAGEQHAVAVGQGDSRAEQRVFGRAQAHGRGVTGPGCGQLRPEALALEGVGGQRGVPGARSFVEGLPVRSAAVDVQFGEGGDQRPGLRPVGAQGGQEDGLVGSCGSPGQGFLAHGAQYAAGAHLEEGGDPVVEERADSVVEADGLADVAYPVAGIGDLLGADEVAGHVGDDRQFGGAEPDRLGEGPEVVQHRFHVRRVEGVADPETLGLARLSLEVGGDLQYAVLVTGDDHRAGSVECGDRDARTQQGPDFVLGGLERDHRPASGESLHQPSAGGHEGGGVLQGQRPRRVGGRQLADGVAEQVVGPDAPGSDEAEQRGLHGEQAGLCVDRPVDQSRGGPAGVVSGEDDVLDRPVEVPVQLGTDGIERLGEHRERLVQPTAHAWPLRTLPGEEETEPAVLRGDAARLSLGRCAGDERAQTAQQAFAGLADDDGPVVEGRAAGGEREGQVQ